MPLLLDDDLPTKFPTPDYLTLTNWKRGVITLIDKSRLPKDALEEADNAFLVEDGQPTIRPGVDWFGTAPSASSIDGFDYFDSNGTIHLVIAAGGTIYRSLDDGKTWTLCTAGTYTAGTEVNMNQNGGFLYLTTGTTTLRYNGTTTLQTYITLATPAAPTVTAGASISGSTYTYYYKVSGVNQVGFSAGSASGSVGVNTPRDNWSTSVAANMVSISHAAVTNATRYDYYLSENNVDFFYIGSSVGTSTTFVDNPSNIVIYSTPVPTDNTTGGEAYKELTNVGSRQFGVRNVNNRYRIGYTSDSYSGSFAQAYGGGFIDWQPGGKFIPVKVVDYKDKSNNPAATVFCSSADGQGCILQMTIDEVTVSIGSGSVAVQVPSIYRLPGSRGTPAPGSVVNVLNDYMFYNSQAFYNFGSRAQFLNMLSTDEASSNIRPTVKEISTAAEEKIASVYSDAKVFFSVPRGSSENNTTMVYDTERKAWLPTAFTIGFKKFLRYTTTGKVQKLLAVKPGDTRLSEIGENIQGDYGVAFPVSITTGLYPTMRNRFDFQWTEEGELELSNPNGTINAELLGIERNRGFRSTNQEQIQATLTSEGWDYFGWDARTWDDTSIVPDTYSESSVKRYFNVQKELNAVQWRITTNSLDAKFVLRTLQSWGTPTYGGKPRSWRIKRS